MQKDSDDLALLVSKLVRELKKYDKNNKLANQATDYLKRKNLINYLRD